MQANFACALWVAHLLGVFTAALQADKAAVQQIILPAFVCAGQPDGMLTRCEGSCSDRTCEASNPAALQELGSSQSCLIEGLMCCRGMLRSMVRGSSRGRGSSMDPRPSQVVSRLHRHLSLPHSHSTLLHCRLAGR